MFHNVFQSCPLVVMVCAVIKRLVNSGMLENMYIDVESYCNVHSHMEAQRCLRIHCFIDVKMSLSVSALQEILQALHRAFSSCATPEIVFCLNFLSSTYILRYSFLTREKVYQNKRVSVSHLASHT